MKTIDKIEKVKNMNVLLEDGGINRTFYWAYIRTQETTNENLDFEDVIWESDVEGIIKNCKEFGLKEITISSNISSMNPFYIYNRLYEAYVMPQFCVCY